MLGGLNRPAVSLHCTVNLRRLLISFLDKLVVLIIVVFVKLVFPTSLTIYFLQHLSPIDGGFQDIYTLSLVKLQGKFGPQVGLWTSV